MATFDIYRKFKEAYETSTHNYNRFAEAINSTHSINHHAAAYRAAIELAKI